MAGLLDGVLGASFDDPRTAATLALAQGLLTSPKAMQGLNGGLLGYQGALAEAKKAKQADEMRQMQLMQHQMALKQAEQAQAKQLAVEQAYRGALRTPDQTAMGKLGGPTVAAANAVSGMAPSLDQNALIQNLMQADPMAAAQMLQPKPRKLTSVAPGASLVDEADPSRAVFTAPKEAAPSDIGRLSAEMAALPPGSPLRAVYQAAITKASTHAPGTSVSVNTGQKGLDNTLKLRGDFRSEPIYKAHQEMQSAYSQIKQALGQASPVGDLAGATKIMKLLDPGSVVRESELGMAMAATGLLDRVQNYASLVMSGQKLTPNQRKEFQTLADRLYSESVNQYNAKRAEYQGIAERNQLNTLDVLGPESAAPKVSVEDLLKKYGG